MGNLGTDLPHGRRAAGGGAQRSPSLSAGSRKYSFQIFIPYHPVPRPPMVLSVLNKGNSTLGDTQEKLTKGREPGSREAYGKYAISVGKRIRGKKKKKGKSLFIILEWVGFTF